MGIKQVSMSQQHEPAVDTRYNHKQAQVERCQMASRLCCPVAFFFFVVVFSRLAFSLCWAGLLDQCHAYSEGSVFRFEFWMLAHKTNNNNNSRGKSLMR